MGRGLRLGKPHLLLLPNVMTEDSVVEAEVGSRAKWKMANDQTVC